MDAQLERLEWVVMSASKVGMLVQVIPRDLSWAFKTIDGLHKAVKGSLVLYSNQGYMYTNTDLLCACKGAWNDTELLS